MEWVSGMGIGNGSLVYVYFFLDKGESVPYIGVRLWGIMGFFDHQKRHAPRGEVDR